MASIGSLFVSISAKTSDFEKSLNEIEKNLTSTGKKIQDVGSTMTKFFTVPVIAAGAAAYKFIQSASDMSETQSKIGELFDQSASKINAWSDSAAGAFGQSKQQALDAAATFAIFGKSAGLGGDDLVNFSTKLTALASDLASFNNTSPEDAINAIGSALRGEAEPMRQFGVLLDDASLKNEAFKMGLIETTTSALTPQQKVLAAQALIFAQTTSAQGDFARTSEGLANQQRILSAQFKDTSAQLGQVLLPLAMELMTAFKTYVMPAVESLVAWFQTLSPETVRVGAAIAVVVAAIGPLLIGLGLVVKSIGALMPMFGGLLGPIGLVILAITGITAALIFLYKNNDEARERIDAAWAKIKQIFMMLQEFVKPIIDSVVTFIKEKLTELSKFWEENGQGILQAVKNIFNFIVNVIQFAIDRIVSIFNFFLPYIKTAFMTTLEFIKSLIDSALQVIMGSLKIFSGIFTGNWSKVWEGVAQIFGGIWDGIRAAFKFSINTIINGLNMFIGFLNKLKINIPKVNIPLVGEVGGFSVGLPQIPNIPQLKTGTNFVPQDMLAMLHKGEAVVPAKYNPQGQSTHIYLDGREITRTIAPQMVDTIRAKLGVSY